MSSFDFDLITIGAGSGGVAASRYAASKGARVAICEAGRVGGTCVLRGCVPKKIFMFGSQFADAFTDAAAYGWDAPQPVFELSRLTTTKNVETTRLEAIYHKLLADAGVKLLQGHAQLLDPHTVQINGERLSAQRLLIATGSSANQPGIAGIYRGFGSAVAMAYRADLPLRGFDADLRQRLAKAMAERGIEQHGGFQPVRLERVGEEFICHGADGRQLRADLVLNALGRSPNTAGMGLEQAGVALQATSGAVQVDEYSRSTVPSIFAIGDVTDRVNLTPVAIAEGRAFVDTEFGGVPRAVDHAMVASAVFSQPQLAAIGLSEEQAKARGHSVQVFEADFRSMKNAFAGRTERSYMKLVVDAASDKVLGLHMIGGDAPEIVQSLAVAVTMGARKRDFDATMAVHPTIAEEFMLMRKPRH